MEQGLAEGLRRLQEAAASTTRRARFVRMFARRSARSSKTPTTSSVLLYEWRSLTETNRRRIVALTIATIAVAACDRRLKREATCRETAACAPLDHGRVNWTGRCSSRWPLFARRDRRSDAAFLREA